ncbi:MAG: hypothetical protein DYG93_04725 [Leptolyngbya sp. PLA2]|nr:hypothetical protein [Leptolyngbya sp.]MCE7970951.1 hypothetical protein [Leptolyngbya sp. PL-A2]MCQ3940234.1 hypothetical protein [cyanobacterium CYA1]MCZ7633793.1 transposase [Phycisphaerales bacterium]MDL1904696.1 hypothetical protein [Synechococcales cyanobacterium CNB]GIK20449.1 MAG: hypothetical protein BroJett004_26130 [Planctomycetota bacterium]
MGDETYIPDASMAERGRSSGEGRGGTYLLTWTTYGTWLPGDSRGFVSPVPCEDGGCVIHNVVGSAYDADMPSLMEKARARMRGVRVVLDRANARVCADAFGEVERRGDVRVLVGAIMATHVHLVVASTSLEGAALLQRFKGVSSRRLTQRFGKPGAPSWWTRHGSRRLLTNAPSVDGALRYVWEQIGALVVWRASDERAG